jgi:23S rRNA maturation mini-RNase III
MFNLVVDRIVDNQPYPTLQAYPRRDSSVPWAQTYPYTQPPDLVNYCTEHGVEHCIYTVADYPEDSYYVVHLAFFDFTVDYIALLPEQVLTDLTARQLRILFYYHEGDDPAKIKVRLDLLCRQHELGTNVYRFVSGNTKADRLENFMYFADHELLYYNRNKNDTKIVKTTGSLMRTFTCLTRTHQWWRATALADLYRRSLLDNSYWSYNPAITVGNRIQDCPIEIDTLRIRSYLTEFMRDGPYRADDLSSAAHNNHALTVEEHYHNAYCNIVFETLFDADGSGGAFLTEKTFKPIKHGQAFVVVGCAGSLQVLRDLGYRVFDSVIDTSYDLIENNTNRWIAVRGVIESIKHGNLELFRQQCAADVEHNRSLFLTSKADRLNMLLRKIQND